MLDFLQLDPAAAPVKGLTSWLTDELRGAVAAGRLPVGSRLPASRELATDLGISRGVVVDAYRRLQDEGLVGARVGAGTVVTARTVPRAPRPLAREAAPAGAIDLDLSPGVPDLSAFPRAAWLRAERRVLTAATAADLGYGDPAGHPALRRELAGWLARTRGVDARPEDVIVVSGVCQALALLCHTLRRRGVSTMALEDPGSSGARTEVEYWGMRTVPVPVDPSGVRVDDLRRTGAPVAVLTPAHQFPTGVVLSAQRRRELLAWAGEGGLVIEDDYDAEHRYDRPPVGAVQAFSPEQVAYTGSTSKTLAPGVRLGWLVAPARLRDDLVEAKHASDLGNAAIPQLVLARLLADGDYDRHLRTVRTRQRQRRDALLAGLREHLPGMRVSGVAAGLHLLVTLPQASGGTDTEMAGRLAGAGVLVQPLSLHRSRPGEPGLVLGYAAHSPDRLTEAARRIAAVIGGG